MKTSAYQDTALGKDTSPKLVKDICTYNWKRPPSPKSIRKKKLALKAILQKKFQMAPKHEKIVNLILNLRN